MWLHLLVLLFSTFVVSYEDKSKNLLVLLENFHIKETHSTFLNMLTTDQTNPLLIDVLHGSKTSYSYNPDKTIVDYPNTVGTNTQLITALQARNNARALFIGSLDFLSNSFFESTVETESQKSVICGNQMLTDNLLRWVLGERGQLRHVYVKHHRVGETLPPSQYTILDDVIYIIKIETKDDNGNWVPFNADDVQLEFVRIDPFIRKKMEHKSMVVSSLFCLDICKSTFDINFLPEAKYKNIDGEYKLVMKLPDVYGVFKFVVDYYRVGYTHLLSVTQVPVRPFTHTQYERFLVAAYPYYGSAISMMIGLILFSFIFLYLKDDKEKGE
uniref:Dolichyl-diphosphooligosaccharide--protein glycosyltransferase 48 kDa subunit n=1 Tax=Schistosoma haematobium TaxID=6185 RepID=A0A095AWB5_SCHHA